MILVEEMGHRSRIARAHLSVNEKNSSSGRFPGKTMAVN
jgi:hypothetical protein